MSILGNLSDAQKIGELFDEAKSNDVLVRLAKKLDGCDAQQAYATLKELSDTELRMVAALIARGNQKFGRLKPVRRRVAG